MRQILIPGLKSTVTINQDSYGVSHVFAQNELDLFFAQGYVTAKDRLVQLELMRRKGKGRLAEILGPTQLDSDWFELTLGLSLTADAQLQEYQRTGSYMLEIIQSYASGVNAHMDSLRSSKKWPAFFQVAGYEPAPWTAIDTLIVQGLITQDLAFGVGQLDRRNLEEHLGTERTNGILPEWPYKKQFPYDQGPYPKNPYCDSKTLYSRLLRLGAGRGVGGWEKGPLLQAFRSTKEPETNGEPEAPSFSEDTGVIGNTLPEICGFDFCDQSDGLLGNSNNWVVGGGITDTGKPYLAGDPHLGLTLPSIWYEIHLCCPTLNVYGVIFPGVPCVIIGHNSDIAWSPTNGQSIQTFFYKEKTDSEHPGAYYHNGKWKEFSSMDVNIPVRGQASKSISIPWTVHGPVVDRLLPHFPGIKKDETISMAYTGNLFSDLMQSMYNLNRAKNADDIEEALSHWGSPSQNFAYATTQGDYGIVSPGYYPLLKSGDPWLVLSGTGECDWAGLIPYEHVPSTKNPERQYASSANERQVGEGYPYKLGSSDNAFCGGWRGQTINAFLDDRSDNPLGKHSMEKLQACNHDSLARTVVPVIVNLVQELKATQPPVALPKEAELAGEILARWDFCMDQDEAAPLLWDAFLSFYFKEVFGPWWRFSGLDQSRRYNLGNLYFSSAGWKGAFLQALEVMTTESPSSAIYRAASCPEGEPLPWLHDPVFSEDRDRDQILLISLVKAVNHIQGRFGPDPRNWSWGRQHMRKIPSLLEKEVLGRGPYPTGGNCRTPNASGGREPSTHGPSWRMIVSLTEPIESWGILPGGQDEDPISPHYDDQFHLWKDCKYKKLLFETEPTHEVSDTIEEVYELVPRLS